MKRTKLYAIIAAILLVVTCGMLCVSAVDFDGTVEPLAWPCCSRYVGTFEDVIGHVQYGEGCHVHIQTKCIKCDTVFDDYVMICGKCTHDRGDYGDMGGMD